MTNPDSDIDRGDPPGTPLQRFTLWISRLRVAFGLKLLLCLTISQALLKGFCGGGGNAGMVGVPIEFLLREYHVDAAMLQIYKGAVLIPWSIKPLMGLVSDALPIAGYHRRPYFAIVAIGGLVACLGIGLWRGLPLIVLLGLLFLIFFQIAMTDLLSEAVYSARLRELPKHGPDLISFIWGSIGIGKLHAVAIIGIIISYFGARSAYLFAAPVVAIALVIPIKNLIEERPVPGRCCSTQVKVDTTLVVIALLMGFGALGLSTLSILGSGLQGKIIAALFLAILVLTMFSLGLNPIIAKINAFFFIQHLCAFGVDGAAFYFFTDQKEQYPEGPHFTTIFYTSVLGMSSTAFSLIGMVVYTRYMRTWRYQKVLMVGNLLASGAGLVGCFVYLRWNLVLGLSDRFFVVASDSIKTVMFEIAWLPGMLIISQVCPEGQEATIFALLAGSGNLGSNLGGYFGSFLLHLLGVEPNGSVGESAQFDRLWLAALISAVGPCLPLCLLPILMPNVSQQDKIEGIANATDGSILARIRGVSSKQAPVVVEFQRIGKPDSQHVDGASEEDGIQDVVGNSKNSDSPQREESFSVL